MAYTGEDPVANVIVAAQKAVARNRLVILATALQRYHALREIMRESRVSYSGGQSVVRSVLLSTTGTFEFTSMHSRTELRVGEILGQIEVPWCNCRTYYAVDEREIEKASGEYQVIDLVRAYETTALIDLAQGLERAFWDVVPNDGRTPYGIQYWVTYGGSGAGTTGFTGRGLAAFNYAPGGLSADTYPQHRNWSDTYSAVSANDLLLKMRTAMLAIDWHPPVDIQDYVRQGAPMAIYTPTDVRLELEGLLYSMNDQVGRDLAAFDGRALFRGVPLTHVSYLDKFTTSKPVYLINWQVGETAVLQDELAKANGPIRLPDRPRTLVTYFDCTFNWIFTERRRLAIIAKADPANGI